MKKVCLLLFLFFPMVLNAECDYKTQTTMTSLSLYIDYSYDYIEETNTFTIYVYNLQNIFGVAYDGIARAQDSEGVVVIKNVAPGAESELNVYGSGISDCQGYEFRNIELQMPYINPYYGTDKCKGYESLTVCYSKFLNFELTNAAFESAIKRNEVSKIEEPKEEVSIFENLFEFVKEYFIKIIIVIVVSTITILIYKSKYRKSKHGF